MKHLKPLRHASVPFALTTCLLGALLGSGCADETGTGITDPVGAASNQDAGESAGAAAPQGGTKSSASGSGSDSGGEREEAGGEAGAGGGTGGTRPASDGGAGAEPQAGMPGAAGQPDEGVRIGHPCSFHTPAEPASGEGGAGGEASVPDVLTQPNVFVGTYLTDRDGRTLYTYGADLPGDCQTPPKSLCVADCLVSWPIFDAGDRVLGAGLDDAAFGSIEREDGSWQTTYMGWPLYYYKTDLSLGQMAGQGKGKLWHVAELVLPTITIMKAGTLKYLADAYGRTLYVSAVDTAGTPLADPISNCRGDCLDTFEPFHEKNFSAVTLLDPLDFAVFARSGGGRLQLSYRGLPLYRAATDVKSGDMTGTAVAGFTAAEP